MFGKKTLYNGSSLYLNNSLDFQAIIYSRPFSSFNSDILNI